MQKINDFVIQCGICAEYELRDLAVIDRWEMPLGKDDGLLSHKRSPSGECGIGGDNQAMLADGVHIGECIAVEHTLHLRNVKELLQLTVSAIGEQRKPQVRVYRKHIPNNALIPLNVNP